MINFELFQSVASRCGYQFSSLCDGEYFQYTETRLLWDLLSYDATYVLDEYLSHERMTNHLFMYYDMESSNAVHRNTDIDTAEHFDLEYERIKLLNAENVYSEFVASLK